MKNFHKKVISSIVSCNWSSSQSMKMSIFSLIQYVTVYSRFSKQLKTSETATSMIWWDTKWMPAQHSDFWCVI